MSPDAREQKPSAKGRGCLVIGIALGFVAGAVVGYPYNAAWLPSPVASILAAIEEVAWAVTRMLEPVYHVERDSIEYMILLTVFFGVLGAGVAAGLAGLLVLVRRK